MKLNSITHFSWNGKKKQLQVLKTQECYTTHQAVLSSTQAVLSLVWVFRRFLMAERKSEQTKLGNLFHIFCNYNTKSANRLGPVSQNRISSWDQKKKTKQPFSKIMNIIKSLSICLSIKTFFWARNNTGSNSPQKPSCHCLPNRLGNSLSVTKSITDTGYAVLIYMTN